MNTRNPSVLGTGNLDLSKSGQYGGATVYQVPGGKEARGGRYVVADADGARFEPLDFLFQASLIPSALRR